MKNAGAEREGDQRRFDKPCSMKVFTYKGERDTLMTPRDSILHHKRIMRAVVRGDRSPLRDIVKAYVGGPNFRYFKYDMAKQGKRQIGSTIKPFVYTFAIDHLGLTPCTMVPNLPRTIETANGTAWSPKEAGKVEYDGVLHPLSWGLARSRNNYSAWIMKQAKQPAAVADFIHNMGIRSYIDPVPALALGSSESNVYELVSAFSTFANEGVHTDADLRDAHRGPAGQRDRQLHTPVAGRRQRAHGLHDADDAAGRGDVGYGRPPERRLRLVGRGDRRQDRHLEQEPRRMVHVRGPETGGGRMGRRRGSVGALRIGRRGQRDGAADRGRLHETGLRRRPSRPEPQRPVYPPGDDAALRLRRGDRS